MFKFFCEIGKSAFVKHLLKIKTIDPSIDDNFALKIAMDCNKEKIVRMLIEDERVKSKINTQLARKIVRFLMKKLYRSVYRNEYLSLKY